MENQMHEDGSILPVMRHSNLLYVTTFLSASGNILSESARGSSRGRLSSDFFDIHPESR